MAGRGGGDGVAAQHCVRCSRELCQGPDPFPSQIR